MSLRQHSPEELAELTGDREALGAHPWRRPARHLDADRFPRGPFDDDPEPVSCRREGIAVAIGASLGLWVVILKLFGVI